MLALHYSDWRNHGLSVCYMQKIEQRYWWEYGEEKTRINKLNEKRSLIPHLCRFER